VRSDVDVDALVTKLIGEVVPWRVARRGVSSASALGADLGIDSLGKVMLAFRLSEELDLDFEEQDVDLGRIETVGDVQATVKLLLQTRAS
jgi:acyl carrier protein